MLVTVGKGWAYLNPGTLNFCGKDTLYIRTDGVDMHAAMTPLAQREATGDLQLGTVFLPTYHRPLSSILEQWEGTPAVSSRQKPDNVATCGCSGVLCVVLCGIPRAELPWQFLSITPDTKGNSDECTTGRAQGTSGWRMNRIYSARPPSLPPSASSLPLLQSKAPHFPHPKFLFFRITPSAWTSFMMYVQVNSLPRLGTRLCIRLSLSFGSRRASAHSLYTRTPWLDSPTTESLDCCYFKLSHLKQDNFLGGWGMIASKYSEFWTLLRNDLLVSDHEKHCFSIKGGVCVCVRLSLCLCVYVCVCGWLTFSGFLTWFKLLLSLCKEFISVQKNKCVVHSP